MDSLLRQAMQCVLPSGFLPVQDLMSIRAVSRDCKALVEQPDGKHLPLDINLGLSGQEMVPDFLVHAGKRYHVRVGLMDSDVMRQVCSMSLHMLCVDEVVDCKMLSDVSTLKHLMLAESLDDGDKLCHLPGSLVSLDVSMGNISEMGMARLSGMSLKKLNLYGCKTMVDDFMVHLPETLTDLNLGCAAISDDGLMQLSSKGMPLRVLKLYGCSALTNSGLRHLPKTLTDLNLSGCRIGSSCLDHLSDMPLVSLNLSMCGVTNIGLSILAMISSLRELDLGGCERVSDEGLGHLSSMRLIDLNLSGCSITDNGLRRLVNMPLECLFLYYCERITQSGLDLFPTAYIGY